MHHIQEQFGITESRSKAFDLATDKTQQSMLTDFPFTAAWWLRWQIEPFLIGDDLELISKI